MESDEKEDSAPILPEPKPEESKSEPKNPKLTGKSLTFGILLIGVVIGLSVGYVLFNFGGVISADAAGEKAVGHIESVFLSSNGLSAEVLGVSEKHGLYAIELNILNGEIIEQTIPVYMTKNGDALFVSEPLDLTIELPSFEPASTEITKSDKPKVQLFIMSFCPFGQQAETGIAPVVKLLGNKIDFEPRFILSVNEDGTYQSLHGPDEALEDIRQACIWKYQKDKFWAYLDNVNSKISFEEINDKWKDAAIAAEVDITKVEECVASEGEALAKADEALSNELGVTGSPTIIINGERYTGNRSPEDFKVGICAAFNTAPEECAQELSTTGTAEGEC